MTTKPEGIPQWTWDEAFYIMDDFALLTLEDDEELIQRAISKAILKAKNDAYEEAAREAEGYDGLGTYPSEGSAYGDSSLTQMDISQAIRNLKHKTEV